MASARGVSPFANLSKCAIFYRSRGQDAISDLPTMSCRSLPPVGPSSRSQKAQVWWEVFFAIKRTSPLQRPKVSLPYARRKQSACCEASAEERRAGNPHATICGSRRRVTASGDPVRDTAMCRAYPTTSLPSIG